MIMGKYKNGILGPFLGKVGTVVGSVWNGVFYMRALANYIKNNPSMSQLDARFKFALMVKFVTGMKSLINVGYQSVREGETPMNAALSYNLKNAITGVSPNFMIDYPKIVYSNGELPAPFLPETEAEVGAEMKFSWIANPSWQPSVGTDKLSICVYNTDKHVFVPASGVATRADLEYTLQLPLDFQGDSVQMWLSFVSVDGKRVSDSVYVGGGVVL